ncbi:MAG: PEP-CTERM sorting domain-containing protein [Armatimonadota bacterium]
MPRKYLLFGAALVCLVVSTAGADSVSFVGHFGDTWVYVLTTTNAQTNDTVVFTNLDGVTSATAPADWAVTHQDEFNVTYTYTASADSGSTQYVFQFNSGAAEGTINWQVNTSNPGSGTATGPQYVPEPTTFAMMGAGLLGMLGLVRMRRKGKP